MVHSWRNYLHGGHRFRIGYRHDRLQRRRRWHHSAARSTRIPKVLQRQIRQEARAGRHLEPAQGQANSLAPMKQGVLQGQYVHSLYLTMPSVLVRVHHIKTMACSPPCGKCKPELVDPARARDRLADTVVSYAGPLVFNVLGEHMDLMPGGKLFHQSNRIALGTAACRFENAVQNSDTQAWTRGINSTIIVHARFLSS